jgi:hypothetical protein
VGGIVAELGQERWYGGGHGTAPASVGDGGNDVNPSEARQKNLVGGVGIGQALDPFRAQEFARARNRDSTCSRKGRLSPHVSSRNAERFSVEAISTAWRKIDRSLRTPSDISVGP